MNGKSEKIDRSKVANAVRKLYHEVASNPEKKFHFPVGRNSCLNLGYPEEELDNLAMTASESFAGVGYPFIADVIKPGNTVVDIGSGAGMDALIARLKAGNEGMVYGIDFTPSMIKKSRENIKKSGLDNIQIMESAADTIPLEDDSVDVVTSNGVIDLVPDKNKAFGEIFRILKPGGRIQISDIVLSKPMDTKLKGNYQLWAERIVGAESVQAYLSLVRAVGFKDVIVIDRLDYFDRSSNENTWKSAKQWGAYAIVLTGRKALTIHFAY